MRLTIALTFALALAALPGAAATAQERPPPDNQAPCLVWWQAPEHLGENVTVCGSPRDTAQRDDNLVLELGSSPTDLRIELPFALQPACPTTFQQLQRAPTLTRLRASGRLEGTATGPLLRLSTCNQLVLEQATAGPGGTGCEFQLGFARLHELIPERVGECLENEHHNPANGDGLQRTSGGLLVWRKADNWTAFTDGSTTWINGPFGLQSRPNGERFRWETTPSSDT